MKIELINHYWPNTIHKLALTKDALPNGQPFGSVWVELFPGATLPRLADVQAKEAEYEALIAKQKADRKAEEKRQKALEAKWADPFALLDDILEKGIAPVKAERDAIKAANPKGKA